MPTTNPPTGETEDAVADAPVPVDPATVLGLGVAFLEVADAAVALGCSPRWLADGANRYGFPHHRLGKSLQFSLQDLEEIRAMHRVPAQPGRRRKPVTKRPRSKPAPARQIAPAIEQADTAA